MSLDTLVMPINVSMFESRYQFKVVGGKYGLVFSWQDRSCNCEKA